MNNSVCLRIKTEIWQSKFYQQSCMILQVAHEWGAPSFKDVFSDRVRSALIPITCSSRIRKYFLLVRHVQYIVVG